MDLAPRDPRISTEFVTANGLSFEVDMCGSGDKFALLLHGFPENSYSWRYQMPLLADMGYRVWAPNLRGYGRSSKPKGIGAYAIDNLIDDVRGLVDAAGAKSVTLMAHDWGAIVAWYAAMAQVKPIDQLVIMNVPHPGAARTHSRNWDQLRKSWYIFFFQIPWLPEFVLGRNDAAAIERAFVEMAVDKSQFPRAVTDVFRRNAMIPGALNRMVNYYRALLRRRPKHPALVGGQLPLIETPTLIVWGEEDTALSKSLTYGTDKFVRDLTIRYLPGVSHWVQQEAPETVNAMLSDFLTGSPVREASDLTPAKGPQDSAEAA